MNVEIIEATPNPDELMCRSARNDYGADATADFEEVMETVNGETIDEKKENLIRKLFNRGHFGIAEHPTLTVSIRGVSRALMAQLTRHRNASFDIMSMRYVEVEEPDVYEFPGIDDGEPTGRGANFEPPFDEYSDDELAEVRQKFFEDSVKESYDTYEELLSMGVAPEHARMVLPIGTKVNIVMTINVRSLLHIADMRAAADAQKEIRDMTEELLDVAEEWCPIGLKVYNEELKNRKNRLAP